ncbi:MAG TPA: ABC transporter substrate-binding protein [Candidatus Binatia bacterium]|jgi:putative ABC transport system substrate-binding protein
MLNSVTVPAANLVAILFMLACAAFEVQAQTARIGILVPELGRAQSQAQKGLIEELKQLGYQRSKNINLEIRNAKRDRAAFQPFANELVKRKANVIFTTGTSATRAAAAATKDVPIVFIHPSDPFLIDFTVGLPGPRANLTGVAAFAEERMDIRLALLKEMVPTLQILHIFYDWNNRSSRDNFARAESIAKKMSLRALGHPIKSIEELNATIGGLDSDQGDVIFQVPDDLIESAAERIFDLARQKKIPTMFNEESWVIAGALAAHGPNYFEMGRKAARLVDRIIKGQHPSSLPVERATKFDLTLNYRTANIIGLRLSQDFLKKADKVIR